MIVTGVVLVILGIALGFWSACQLPAQQRFWRCAACLLLGTAMAEIGMFLLAGFSL